MRNTQFILGFVILISISLISGYLLTGDDEQKRSNQAYAQNQFKPGQNSTSFTTPNGEPALSKVPQILPVPERLFFAGEEVPLHRPDIRERFEKELYITAHRYYQVIFYLKRGPRILPYLKDELSKAGIPEDFAYLAVIESDLIPTITSPKGARGLWQFMPETGRRFGLQVNSSIDERVHVEKSTDAAIRFLKNAREKTGSWTTACAAYNMGLARTIRIMENQGGDSYYKLYLNPETRRYVFKILAAKVIIEHPENFGYTIPENEEYSEEEYQKIRVSRGISDLVEWAEKRGTSYYDIKRMNPWILKQSLPQGNYFLKIPE